MNFNSNEVIRWFINAVIWILRTGAPWRDLPPEFGDWKNTNHRFCRWRDKDIWKKLFNFFVQAPDFVWLMIDASYIKVHPHAAGTRDGNQEMDRTKGGFNSKKHLAVDADGIPVCFIVTTFGYFLLSLYNLLRLLFICLIHW